MLSPTFPPPYFSSQFFKIFVTHPPNINELDTVVTPPLSSDPDTPKIWNVHILGKNRLCRLGFNIPVGRITARQAVMLNKAAEEPPSESDITGVDDIELKEIAEKASGIISQIKNVQTDTDDLFEHPLRELLGLDKQLRSIRGLLKVEVAKRLS